MYFFQSAARLRQQVFKKRWQRVQLTRIRQSGRRDQLRIEAGSRQLICTALLDRFVRPSKYFGLVPLREIERWETSDQRRVLIGRDLRGEWLLEL